MRIVVSLDKTIAANLGRNISIPINLSEIFPSVIPTGLQANYFGGQNHCDCGGGLCKCACDCSYCPCSPKQ